MNDIEYKRERRFQQTLERLGSNSPQCLFCPEDDPCCLEQHHLSGKKFGDNALELLRVPPELVNPLRDAALHLIDLRSANLAAKGQPA